MIQNRGDTRTDERTEGTPGLMIELTEGTSGLIIENRGDTRTDDRAQKGHQD